MGAPFGPQTGQKGIPGLNITTPRCRPPAKQTKNNGQNGCYLHQGKNHRQASNRHLVTAKIPVVTLSALLFLLLVTEKIVFVQNFFCYSSVCCPKWKPKRAVHLSNWPRPPDSGSGGPGVWKRSRQPALPARRGQGGWLTGTRGRASRGTENVPPNPCQKSRNLQKCNPLVVSLPGWKQRGHSPCFPDLVPVLLSNATRVARALPASANRRLCIWGLNVCRSGSFCAKLNAQ